MSDVDLVIPGERAVHDGLGNKLEGTTRNGKTGKAVRAPVHSVPERQAKLMIKSDMAEEATAAQKAAWTKLQAAEAAAADEAEE